MRDTNLCDAFDGATNSEHSLVHTGDDLGHSGLHAGLFPEIGHIFSAFSDDDASLLGTDESAKSENVGSGRRGRA